jgi:hypothetical protein
MILPVLECCTTAACSSCSVGQNRCYSSMSLYLGLLLCLLHGFRCLHWSDCFSDQLSASYTAISFNILVIMFGFHSVITGTCFIIMRKLSCCNKYFKDKLCEDKNMFRRGRSCSHIFILFASLNERK